MSVNCILIVGSTGTGKSTTISLCTDAPVDTSEGTEECTLDIKSFQHGDEAWIDTIGFDGTDTDRSDDEAFQHILRFLQEKGRTHVKAVIWTVKPDIRQSATLQSQASLIEKFKQGRVWDNVIIAVKEPGPDVLRNAAGAKAAAEKYCNASVLTTLGYTLKDSLPEDQQTIYNRMKAEDRACLNVLTNEEVKSKLRSSISSLPQPFQVLFLDSRCNDCGVVADTRLLPMVCHTRPEQVHVQDMRPYHPGTTVSLHTATLSSRHTAGVAYRRQRTTGGHLRSVLGTHKYKEVPYMSCCNKEPGSQGCQAFYPCCGVVSTGPTCRTEYSCCKALGSGGEETGCGRRYPCCGGEEGSNGCLERCAYCLVKWGQENPKCVGKSHQNVVNIR